MPVIRTAAAQGRSAAAMLERLPVMVFRAGMEAVGPMEYVSAGARRAVGITPEEFCVGAARLTDLIEPEDRTRYEAELRRAGENGAGSSYAIRYRVRPRDGEPRWVKECGLIVSSEAGGLAREAVLAAEDRSETGWEVEIGPGDREAHSHGANGRNGHGNAAPEDPTGIAFDRTGWLGALEHLPLPCCVIDENCGRFVAFNAAFLRLYGYSRDQIGFLRASPPPDAGAALSADEFASAERRESPFSFRWDRRRDGGRFAAEVAAGRFNEGGSRLCCAAVIDLDERSAADEALRKSEQKYRALVETTDTGYAILDPSGTVLDANTQYARLAGHESFGDIAGRKVREWTAPDSVGRTARALERCVKEGRLRNIEIDYLDRLGGFTPIEINATSLPADGGPRILCLCRDISEQRRAQEAIVRSRDYYLRMLDTFPALIWRAGVDGSHNYFNRTWLRFTGRSMEDETGDGWLSGVHPEDAEACRAAYRVAFEKREAFAIQYRLRRADGEFRWITDNGHPLEDEGGGFAGFRGYCYDVTERVAAEAALRESEARAHALAAISPVGIFRTDAAGRCTYLNGRGHEILDLRPGEESGFGWTLAIHPEDRAAFQREWKRFSDSLDVFLIEFRAVRRNGNELTLLAQAAPEFDESGYATGCVGTLLDFTERRRLEEEQLRSSKLESLGVLAGGIAHDFNNLLTPIILNLANALADTAVSGSASAPQIQDAIDAASRARGLTQQLLTFAKGGAPVKRTARLTEILEDSARFVLHGTGVRANIEIDETVLAGVSGCRAAHPGGAKLGHQLDAGDGRARRGPDPRLECDRHRAPDAPAGGRAIRVHPGDRYRLRHPAGESRQSLRPILHDQGARPRAGAGQLDFDHPAPRGRHGCRIESRKGHHIHHLSAGQFRPGRRCARSACRAFRKRAAARPDLGHG
ncbi:MAG: PAS domain S-box protein [Verrucomicrobiales bacterium]